jgi:hypothetical protein
MYVAREIYNDARSVGVLNQVSDLLESGTTEGKNTIRVHRKLRVTKQFDIRNSLLKSTDANKMACNFINSC